MVTQRQPTSIVGMLQHSGAHLPEAQRLSHTGSFNWKISAGEIVQPEDAAIVKQSVERRSHG